MSAFLSQPELTQPAFADGNTATPFPYRVTHVQHNGASGRIVVELDRLHPDEPWPTGCFGVESIWQVLSFYLALRGVPGTALPLGCKEISCLGQLRAHHTRLRYDVSVTQVSQLPQSGASIAMGNGVILADSEPIFSVHEAQVAAFSAIQQDSPAGSSHPRAGGSSSPAALKPMAIAV